MDSRLMSQLQDDIYVKFGQESCLWPNDSVTMDMQLTETLDGILPITDNIDDNDGLMSKNALIYSEFADQQFIVGDSIQILAIDTEANNNKVDDDDDDGTNVVAISTNVDFDNESLCSYMTFRTRTDSSSIGDYESHSSDYDDDTDNDDDHVEYDITCNKSEGDCSVLEQFDFTNNVLQSDSILLDADYETGKHNTSITNTICSDIDGLGLQIDANNFDLADYITKDDFALSLTKSTTNSKSDESTTSSKSAAITVVGLQTPVVQKISSKNSDSDSDSDLIIDVETVEIETNESNFGQGNKKRSVVGDVLIEEDVAFVDNIKADPSWSPKQTKKTENAMKETKQLPMNSAAAAITTTAPNSNNDKSKKNMCLVPNKKQCDFLKRKINAKTSTKPSSTTKSTKPVSVRKTAGKTMPKPTPAPVVGVGQGGKNLALLKQEKSRQSETEVEEKCASVEKKQPEVKELESKSIPPQAVKRKLNLEEYKKRRADVSTASGMPLNKQQKLDTTPQKSTSKSVQVQVHTDKPISVTAPKMSPIKRNEDVAAIVKSLKTQSNQRQVVDPITEAKNKVLRMQQLKRAQQLKILDSTVSAKVPRVTKLPPLKEIVKGSYFQEPETKAECNIPTKAHPDYEEIIIVSVSCNTELTIPPRNMHKVASKSSRSLLKSSVLLHNISDSFQKVQKVTDKTEILSNSLIASIQHEVVKKTIPIIVPAGPVNSESCTINATKNEQHGEDKVIMYLPKNRERKPTACMAVQTDMQPEFPMLTLLKKLAPHKSRERLRHKASRSYRKRNTSSASRSCSASSASSNESLDSECPSNASTERMRNSDATAAGGYSSRSTRRHRSSISSSYSDAEDYERGRRQRRTSYNKRRLKNYDRSNSPLSTSSESDYEHSRARSRSPLYRRSRSRSRSRTRLNSYNNTRRNFVDRNVSQPAVEERRIVYVGRIEQDTTKDMLRRKFLRYGTIKQITIHYKETGMKYGFVTFERSQDAFTAIDTSSKDPQINMYDISFGGRRAFCRASYADLDNAGINNYQSYVFPKPKQQPKEDDSFEALLLKVKAKMNANKPPTTQTPSLAGQSEHAPSSGNESKM